MNEALIQAGHAAGFARQHLQEALAKADPVEALVLLPLIADAARLAQGVAALAEARGGRG